MSGLELEAAAGKPEVRSLHFVGVLFPCCVIRICKPETWQMMGMYVPLHILTQSNWTPKAGAKSVWKSLGKTLCFQRISEVKAKDTECQAAICLVLHIFPFHKHIWSGFL